jgi:NitT/TauT family transport system permease protein
MTAHGATQSAAAPAPASAATESAVAALRRTQRTRRTWGVLLPFIGFALLLAVWWALKAIQGWDDFILPSPAAVVDTIVERRGYLLDNVGVTFVEILAGFALSIAIALPIGIGIAYSWVIDRMVSPLLLAFNAVPKVAIAPVLVIWMGFSELPKIVMVVLLCFFPIVLSTAAGMKSTPQEYRDLVRSLNASPLQAFRKVRLPYALPQIFVGLKVAISLAVIGAVIGEFVGADSGLGYVIIASGSSADTALAFASIVLLSAISVVLYYAIIFVERLVVPWADEEKR